MLKAYLLAKAYADSLLHREEGQSLVEYALIIVLIAVVVIVALGPLGNTIADVFENITGSLGG